MPASSNATFLCRSPPNSHSGSSKMTPEDDAVITTSTTMQQKLASSFQVLGNDVQRTQLFFLTVTYPLRNEFQIDRKKPHSYNRLSVALSSWWVHLLTGGTYFPPLSLSSQSSTPGALGKGVKDLPACMHL